MLFPEILATVCHVLSHRQYYIIHYDLHALQILIHSIHGFFGIFQGRISLQWVAL